jgi:hypothetical protein
VRSPCEEIEAAAGRVISGRVISAGICVAGACTGADEGRGASGVISTGDADARCEEGPPGDSRESIVCTAPTGVVGTGMKGTVGAMGCGVLMGGTGTREGGARSW